jgi:hypothetical protein
MVLTSVYQYIHQRTIPPLTAAWCSVGGVQLQSACSAAIFHLTTLGLRDETSMFLSLASTSLLQFVFMSCPKTRGNSWCAACGTHLRPRKLSSVAAFSISTERFCSIHDHKTLNVPDHFRCLCLVSYKGPLYHSSDSSDSVVTRLRAGRPGFNSR